MMIMMMLMMTKGHTPELITLSADLGSFVRVPLSVEEKMGGGTAPCRGGEYCPLPGTQLVQLSRVQPPPG
jgi:hypothetical protein